MDYALKVEVGDEYIVTPEALGRMLASVNFNVFKIEIINRVWQQKLMYLVRISESSLD
jgi:hypothetical protein